MTHMSFYNMQLLMCTFQKYSDFSLKTISCWHIVFLLVSKLSKALSGYLLMVKLFYRPVTRNSRAVISLKKSEHIRDQSSLLFSYTLISLSSNPYSYLQYYAPQFTPNLQLPVYTALILLRINGQFPLKILLCIVTVLELINHVAMYLIQLLIIL